MTHKYYYFGKAISESASNIMPRTDWVPDWHYRIKVQEQGSFLILEDTHERYMPISFNKLSELQDVLTSLKGDLITDLVGGESEWPL
jgi:hypothetical protein